MGVFSALIICLHSSLSYSNGVFSEFESLNESLKISYEKSLNKLINKDFDISDIADMKSVKLDYDFINVVNFYSASRYILLSTYDKCSVYDFFATNLAKSANGDLKYVIFNYINKKSETKKHVLRKDVFLKQIAYKQCPKSQKLRRYFQLKNFKSFLKTVKITIPKSYPECIQDINDFKNKPTSIFLCSIIEDIRKAPKYSLRLRNLSKLKNREYSVLEQKLKKTLKYKSLFNKKSLQYIQNMCLQVAAPRNYCRNYFKVNYWTKMLKDNIITSSMNHHCSPPFDKSSNFKECIKSLSRENSKCLFSDPYSLQPQPVCSQLATSLMNSRLFTEYKDCPSKSGSQLVTQTSRIISHINNGFNENSDNCSINSTYPTAKYDKDFLDSTVWNVKLCYDDKIKRKEVCYQTLMGDTKDADLSLSKNVERVLSRLRGFNRKSNSCKIIKESQYKPSLLEFRTGCYIVKNQKKCDGVNCDFKVILGDIEFKDFKLKSNLSIDIFPKNFKDENKSFFKLFERYQQKKLKLVRNISTLKRVFSNHKKAIFIGSGCAEKLLPSFFTINSMNQCTISHYIVDGIVEEDKKYSLNVRTSMDNIHAPRLIPWKYVYESLVQYQKVHPLNMWSFYALY